MALEALFRPFRGERVIHDQDGLLVVDKPPGMVVHGGDESLETDLVRRLQRLLRERGEDDYLGVHQRLDQDASGAIFFTRKRDQNQKVADAMASHTVRRVYLAAVSFRDRLHGECFASKGFFEDRLETLPDGSARVVATGGKHARASYRILERHGERALVELEPETGRTHQLRVQLASRGLPIAGDRLYGGHPAERLMLHARRVEIPVLRVAFDAREPPELKRFVSGADHELGDPAMLHAKLLDAGTRRSPLCVDHDVFRVVNDVGDLLPGLVVDRYGDYLVLSTSSEECFQRRLEIAETLVRLGARGVYLKVRARADLRRLPVEEVAPKEPLAGEAAPEVLEVHEGPLRLRVRLGVGLSTGLFVDQRGNRRRIRESSMDARVLNLFSYTCSFTAAAALGGARETVSIDVAGPALAEGRQNLALHGLDPARHRFIKEDAVRYLERAARRGERFDLVILDPPSFATKKRGGTFRAERDYGGVAALSIALLSEGGRLLAVTNHRGTSVGALRKLLRAAAERAGRKIEAIRDQASQLDCPEHPDGPFPSKSVLLTVR